MRLLEKLHTKHFFSYVFVVCLAALGTMYLAVQWGWLTQAQLATGVDIALKTVAALASTAWALNRYCISRADVPQIRIDPNVSVVPCSDNRGKSKLLLFRLDLVNTAKVKLEEVDVAVSVFSVSV